MTTDESDRPRYPIEGFFAFGFWGGSGHKPYTLGFEGFLREMRRLSMNCLVCAPTVNEQDTGSARFKRQIALCRKYAVHTIPHVGDPSRIEAVAALRDDPTILGWYMRDEPPPEFLPDFLKCRDALADVAPDQPALCLFYRPDSVEAFAPHQPVLLTDCYPFGYMHDGVSLGPHFGIKDGPLALGKGLGNVSPWGRRGILEWMDLCRSLAGDLPHWITLQTFESGDGRTVRWREPTAPEMRLQTWLAVAGGAKGITYFHYMHSTDDYGNPRPARHGEFTPLLEEIGRLGGELLPLGSLLADAEVAEPITLVSTLRPTPDPGDRVEVRRLRSKTREVDYLVVFNNDVQVSSSALVNLTKGLVARRSVYDLGELRPVATEDQPGAVTFEVKLKPGDGRMLVIASDADFEPLSHAVLKGRALNDVGILSIEYELAEKSGVDVKSVASFTRGDIEAMEAGDYGIALRLVRKRKRGLLTAIRKNASFWATKENLEYVGRALGRMSSQPAAYQGRLSAAYVGLLGLFWEGSAASIRDAAETLRDLVEQAEGSTSEGGAGRIGDRTLREVEHVAEQYQQRES